MPVGVVKTCYGNDGILVDENVELDLLSNDSCRFFFPLLYRPYHTLLFLVDERYLLASLAGDCSPAITRLVKMASPLKRYSLGCHMLFNNIDLASSLWSKCYMYLGRKQVKKVYFCNFHGISSFIPSPCSTKLLIPVLPPLFLFSILLSSTELTAVVRCLPTYFYYVRLYKIGIEWNWKAWRSLPSDFWL